MKDTNTIEDRLDRLTEMVTHLGKLIREIYVIVTEEDRYTQPKPNSFTKPQTTSTTSDTNLTTKDSVNWDELLEELKGTSDEMFVKNIYSNKYPTITQKQEKVLKDIADGVGVEFYL